MPLIFFTCGQRLFPKDLVVTMQVAKVGADGRLVLADGCDVFYNAGQAHILGIFFAVAVALAGNEHQHIRPASLEMRVTKLPYFVFGVAYQDTLLKMWNFVKIVHIELAHERCKSVVLVEARQHCFCKFFMSFD